MAKEGVGVGGSGGEGTKGVVILCGSIKNGHVRGVMLYVQVGNHISICNVDKDFTSV